MAWPKFLLWLKMIRENWRSEYRVRMCRASGSRCSDRWHQAEVKRRLVFTSWRWDIRRYTVEYQPRRGKETKFYETQILMVRSKEDLRQDATRQTRILEPGKNSRPPSAHLFLTWISYLCQANAVVLVSTLSFFLIATSSKLHWSINRVVIVKQSFLRSSTFPTAGSKFSLVPQQYTYTHIYSSKLC